MLLKDKVALVTGAGSGIGRAIAKVMAREGAHLLLADRDEDGLRQTLQSLGPLHGQAHVIRADVAVPDDAAAMVAAAVRHWHRLDVACNNAGVGGALAPLADYPQDEWARVLSINLTGVFLCMQAQIRQMLRNGGGAIVNVASILGQVGFAQACAYTAAKHGVVGLTRVAALEVGSHGIRVNAVGPGFIHTPMIAHLEQDDAAREQLVQLHPAGRLGMPGEVAEAVAWLACERASFVTGAYLAVDGGYLAR